MTLERITHDKLRYAQELLGHQIPGGDLARVLDRVLDLAIPRLEKSKFAASSKPRQPEPRAGDNPRYIPVRIRRAVWEWDQGRCTYMSDSGRRCEARTRLEFDHIEEIARGGDSTMTNLRLRCRAHNQNGAECTFGSEFMRHKRIAAAETRAAARSAAPC